MSATPRPSGEKPTINDIARTAGVSLATVDRVLNARPGVRAATVAKVQQAIETLGYVRDAAAANLARRRVYKLLFVLPDNANEFVLSLRDEVAGQAGALRHERTHMQVEYVPPFDGAAVVALLDTLDPAETHGVALFGPDTADVQAAVVRAEERGIAVVALVADLPGAVPFVGIDNRAAGRTAGRLMARFIGGRGKVAVITGSHKARDHVDRRAGFDAVLADFPQVEVVETLEGQDDPEQIARALPDVLARHPETSGLYSAAGGNQGVVESLNQLGRSDLVVVGHELTPLNRAALESGVFDALISQNTGHLVRSAVRRLRAAVDGTALNAQQEHIRIDIYLKENLPPFDGAEEGEAHVHRD